MCTDSLPEVKRPSPKTDKVPPEDGKQEAQPDEPIKIFEAYDALILEQHKHRPVLEFDTFDMALDEFHGKVKPPLAFSSFSQGSKRSVFIVWQSQSAYVSGCRL